MAHYLITGHTGFKGSWLTLLLKSQGHEVSGLALDPAPGSMFERANIAGDLARDFRVDVRDREAVKSSFQEAKPDVVVHMAAQSLVREGYRNPIETYETNTNGTLHVLQAAGATDSVISQLVVTTDKVYRDNGLNMPYRESDPLGGGDPYSASKAMADLLAQEFFLGERTAPGAIARAGNVIGAGDNSNERIIPDVLRSVSSGEPLAVRYPEAVRPWQHVLDCLNGYMAILDHSRSSTSNGTQWNIGPDHSEAITVSDLLKRSAKLLEPRKLDFVVEPTDLPEASLLELDTAKARKMLGWGNKLTVNETLEMALSEVSSGNDASLREIVDAQIRKFLQS